MPTYLQLASEQVWLDQYVPANLTDLLIEPLRQFYNMGPTLIGAPGDNNHLYGRHRSTNWDRQSRYCTDRSYATTDDRDWEGDQNWYRALDVGIQDQVLFDASRRMDALARSGECPGLAEWFGTFDGVTVVGWFEGHPSTSDGSHLWHLHVGLWTQYANDPSTLHQILETITGHQGDDMLFVGTAEGRYFAGDGFHHRELPDANTAETLAAASKAVVLNYGPATTAAQLLAIIGPTPYVTAAGDLNPDALAIIAAMRGEADAVKAEVRDAVADLGEGGAAAVRNDPDA